MTTENKKTYVIKDDNYDSVIGVLVTDRNSTEVYDLITKACDLAEKEDIGQTTAFKSLLNDKDCFTEDIFIYYM